jgi:hypothetical protein
VLVDCYLFPHPDAFTELSFPHPSGLPTHYIADEKQLVTFIVRNHEGHAQQYHYRITEEADNLRHRERVLAVGTFTVANESARAQTNEVTVQPLGRRVLVKVSLINKGQSIYYWLTLSKR